MSKSTTPNTNIAELLLRRVSKIVYMPIETNVVIRNMIPANMPLEDELKTEQLTISMNLQQVLEDEK